MKNKLPFILFFGIIANCFALEDSPANRATEASRYLAATPPTEMFADMAANMSKNMPEAQRQPFIDTLTKNLDIAELSKAMKASMIKNFTADELKALADFYSSPEGKSSMKKMGIYMADLMPVIQAEVQKAMQKSQAPASETD